MKKMKYILNGFLTLAFEMMFTQCKDQKEASNNSQVVATVSGNMKIAYVEIDSLLTKYRFWNDLNELMIQKEENIRTTLNEKAKDLDNDMREFQRKLENNGFVSPERAEQERVRIVQKQQKLQELQEKSSCLPYFFSQAADLPPPESFYFIHSRFLSAAQFLWRIQMSRDAVYHNRRHVALDQRTHISDKLIGHIRSVFADPFSRNQLFVVGDLMYVFDFGSALIRIVRQSLKNHHLA